MELFVVIVILGTVGILLSDEHEGVNLKMPARKSPVSKLVFITFLSVIANFWQWYDLATVEAEFQACYAGNVASCNVHDAQENMPNE